MKHWKVSRKIITGFGGVIGLMLALFVVFLVLFTESSEANVATLNRTATFKELLQETSLDVMNMRRLVVMIHAFNGEEARIDSSQNDFNTFYASANDTLDTFASLVEDSDLPEEERTDNLEAVEEMKDLIYQYKTLLFDPNVESAKRSDVAALNASNAQYAPLIASVSEYIDALIVEADDSKAAASARAGQSTRALIIVFLSVVAGIAVLAAWMGLYISGLISKPLAPLTAFMKKAGGTGNVMMSETERQAVARYAERKDEIGQIIAETASFVRHVTEVSAALETVAGGDISQEIPVLSGEDTLGLSLRKMSENLNGMFTEINVSSGQVSTGSSQVADGAQSLAQGATQQAASIEQLSSSISDVAERTKQNAGMAGQAADLAETIKGNAETGSRQMDEMIAAVKQISEASQSIGRVIKTINDIAFQTNILALNASVEAAHAGQHGKGFAVVADEVRNLAAKSSEAAKDTEGLIANSIEKAELGVRIAGETSDSLAEIVSGINESSRLVSDIARSSEDQSSAIAQINIGIDQVAQVVQQNSATAEESAAASEEMSGQSSTLMELIAQFKLKTEGTAGNVHKRLGIPQKSELSHDGAGFGKY